MNKKAAKPAPSFFNNNKFVAGFFITLFGTIIIGLCGGMLIGTLTNGGGETVNENSEIVRGGGIGSNEPAVVIKASDTKNIQYEKFDNGLVSMQIPKGWKVETNTSVLIYTIHAYDPSHPERQIFAMLKSEGYNKSQESKNWYASYYSDSGFGRMPVISPQTTEGFYKAFPGVYELKSSEADTARDFIQKYTDFTTIENLGKTILGGDLLRASYQYNGKKVQGLFTATVVNFGTYMVKKNPYNFYDTTQIDASPLSVYDIFFFTAGDDEFNSWQSILDKCVGTLEYSNDFMQAHAKALQGQSERTKILSQAAQQISDGIMDSWNKRQTSYDITSQKQSDATLGYERVKDTETGEIYRATNGFMDSYSGTRYQAISDSDYTLGIDGYIILK